ncbi:MAG: type IV secretion system protein, partial [Patescibacteria group bacterium]
MSLLSHLNFKLFIRHLAVGLFLVVLIGLWPHGAAAFDVRQDVLIPTLQTLVSAVGRLNITVITTLASVASYNEFILAPTVVYGWVLVRDMANMFFVVVLLIIAISTILNIDSYNYKKLLPKVVILAVLVNFSRTIAGLAIDAAQVVMLTFVAGFKDVGPGNFMAGVGLADVLTFNQDSIKAGNEPSDLPDQLLGLYFYALLYLVALLVVLIIMVIVLIFRIVMLWLLVVLSPLFYVLMAFPGGQSYAGQWSSQFTKYVIVGPVLAFFIWLSMATFSGSSVEGFAAPQPLGTTANQTESDKINVSLGEAGQPDFLVNFIVAIGLLVGGLTITSQMGVAGGKLGMSVVGKAQALGLRTAKWAAKTPFRTAAWVDRKQGAYTGLTVNPMNYWRGFQASRETQKKKDLQRRGDIVSGRIGEHNANGRLRRGKLSQLFGSPEDFFNDGILKSTYSLAMDAHGVTSYGRDEKFYKQQAETAKKQAAASAVDPKEIGQDAAL